MRRKPAPEEFKWRHYEPEIILCCVRWHLRYQLSYRDLAEIMHMVFKGQLYHLFDRTSQGYKNFIHRQFGLAGAF